jgi:outer membrane protein
MKKPKLIVLFFLCLYQLNGQDILSLDDVISRVLKNNYGILISKNDIDIAKNDVSPGNAGMLPSISLSAGGSLSGSNTQQEFVTGNSVDNKSARSDNINSGIALNWTLFDGLKMFVSYDKLKETHYNTHLLSKIQIENAVAETIGIYYEIVRQKLLVEFYDSTLTLYDQRQQIAKVRWEIGKAPKTDYLQAQMDLNTWISRRILESARLSELKYSLNRKMNQAQEIDFDVTDEIYVNVNLKLPDVKSSSTFMNRSILQKKSEIAISEFSLQEYKASRYPEISLLANYNFSRTNNQAGFLLFNQNLGWNLGISARWNLFDGFNLNRNIRNAGIRLQNARFQYEDQKSEIEQNVYTSFKKYKSSLERLRLDGINMELAKENLSISFESFRLGKATTIELKEAQQNYEETKISMLQTNYEAKLAETELLRLMGDLVR